MILIFFSLLVDLIESRIYIQMKKGIRSIIRVMTASFTSSSLSRSKFLFRFPEQLDRAAVISDQVQREKIIGDKKRLCNPFIYIYLSDRHGRIYIQKRRERDYIRFQFFTWYFSIIISPSMIMNFASLHAKDREKITFRFCLKQKNIQDEY